MIVVPVVVAVAPGLGAAVSVLLPVLAVAGVGGALHGGYLGFSVVFGQELVKALRPHFHVVADARVQVRIVLPMFDDLLARRGTVHMLIALATQLLVALRLASIGISGDSQG